MGEIGRKEEKEEEREKNLTLSECESGREKGVREGG